MPVIELPITNGASVSQSLPLSAQELNNMYSNISENGGYSDRSLLPTQGKKLILNTDAEEIGRGIHVMNDIPYVVNGSNLYKLTRTIDDISGEETFSVGTALGTVSGDGFVSMADNGTQLMIVVPGSDAYIYNRSTDVFAAVTDTVFTTTLGPSNGVNYIDGFFVHTSSKSGSEDTIFHSNLNDGLTYTATDFGSAAVDPDKIKIGHVHLNKFYALGSETIEVFDNVGGSGFVFQRRDGFVIPKGILANFTVSEFDGGFVFLGAGVNEQPALWKVTGSSLTRLSTTTIQDQIAKFTDTEISNAFTWISGVGGAYFIHLTIGDKTFSYDSTASNLSGSKIWHNRTSYNNDVVGRDRANGAVTAYGRVIVNDYLSGRIGELSDSTYDEYGNEIIRTVASQPLTDLNEPINVSYVELAVESGVGDSTTEDPQISLEVSYDGGRSFGSKRYRSIGEQGDWLIRPRWPYLGRVDTQAVFRFTISEKVKVVLLKLMAWVE